MREFISVLKNELDQRQLKLEDFYDRENPVEKTLLAEYGAVFVAQNGAIPAPKIVFRNAQEVSLFQEGLSISKCNIGGYELELQTPAMNDLLGAIAEAGAVNLTISPRGADSARRDYTGTIHLWGSRVNPALDHWKEEGKLSLDESNHLRTLAPFDQVPVIFELEKKGIFFSKDLSKSIIYSVAPPGASQHLALLAFDVTEFKDEKVRRILANHGWFQTVLSDLPHFTYLGAREAFLPQLGLKKVENAGQSFWIPNL